MPRHAHSPRLLSSPPVVSRELHWTPLWRNIALCLHWIQCNPYVLLHTSLFCPIIAVVDQMTVLMFAMHCCIRLSHSRFNFVVRSTLDSIALLILQFQSIESASIQRMQYPYTNKHLLMMINIVQTGLNETVSVQVK